jgi:hypothetical protein
MGDMCRHQNQQDHPHQHRYPLHSFLPSVVCRLRHLARQ